MTKIKNEIVLFHVPSYGGQGCSLPPTHHHQTPFLSLMNIILWSYNGQSLSATLASINVHHRYPLISLYMADDLDTIMVHVLMTAKYITNIHPLMIQWYCIFLSNLFFFFLVKGKIILGWAEIEINLYTYVAILAFYLFFIILADTWWPEESFNTILAKPVQWWRTFLEVRIWKTWVMLRPILPWSIDLLFFSFCNVAYY